MADNELISFVTLEELENDAIKNDDSDLLKRISLAKRYGVTEEEFLLFQKFFCYTDTQEVVTGSPLVDIFRKGNHASTRNSIPLYFDLLYQTFGHGSSHIGAMGSKDKDRIPIVNEWKYDQPRFLESGHPGLMSPEDKDKLDKLTSGQDSSGHQTFKNIAGISGTPPDYILKVHQKLFVGGQPASSSPNFNSTEWTSNKSLIPDRGGLFYGGVHLAIDNTSSLKVGNPVKIELKSNGEIVAESLTLTKDLVIDNIKVKKCLYTTLDDGSEDVLQFCKNKIINNNGTSFDDIHFYVKKGTHSEITSSTVPSMIIGQGGVAINKPTAPSSSDSYALNVGGSAIIGSEGSDVPYLKFYGSLIEIGSSSGTTIRNITLTGGQPTSLDITSYGGLTLQGDGTIGNSSPVRIGHTNNPVGVSIYGGIAMTIPNADSYPFAFYNDVTYPLGSAIGSPLTLFVDGTHNKVGIGDLPGTETMRVLGGAEFISKSPANTAKNWVDLTSNEGDNKLKVTVIENPGNPLDPSQNYSPTVGNYGARGTLILRGTNQTRGMEVSDNNDDIFDIILTGGLSDAWQRTANTGIQHGVRIDGKLQVAEKVDIKSGGINVAGDVSITNGSIQMGTGQAMTIIAGGGGLAFGGTGSGYDYYFNNSGEILAHSLLLGFVYDNITGEHSTSLRYGIQNDGLTRVHDLFIYGDILPQNITSMDLQGGWLHNIHDLKGYQAPRSDSDKLFNTPKDGFYGEISDYKSITGSGEAGYISGNDTNGVPYHIIGSTAGGGHAYPYSNWSNISNFHNIFSVSAVKKEYGYVTQNEVFSREDQLIGKVSGFKYILAGDYSKHSTDSNVGDSPTTKPYIRGFSSIYGLFSDGVTNNNLNKSWDSTNAGDIMYFKNIVGFDSNQQAGVANKIKLLIPDPNDPTQNIINTNYPDYLGGDLKFFKNITGVSDSYHRGSISNFKDISLSYFDSTLKRNITTAEFTKTSGSIFKSLLTIGDPSSSDLDLYSGFIFKGGGITSQKDVTLNWDSAKKHFSFHYTDNPSTPSSPDKNNPAPNDPNWATVKVGTLWIKGEELTTPASVINALNDNGVLFTDGTNKMLGNININRNNIDHTTIAYVDEIKITEKSNPFHLSGQSTDPTTLNIYSNHSGNVSPGYLARSLLISPSDGAYVVLGQDNKSTGLIIGKYDTTTSKIIAGWDKTASAQLSLNYRNSGTITEGLKIESDGDINIPSGDVLLASAKSLKIGTTQAILDKDSLTVGTNTTLAGTGITVDSDFTIKTGGSSGTVNFKVENSSNYVGIGDWSTGSLAHTLDVKGSFQSSGTTSGTSTTYATFKDTTDPYVTIERVNHVVSSNDIFWSTISSNATSSADQKLTITASDVLNLNSSEIQIGGVDSTTRGIGEQGRLSWENETFTKTSSSGDFPGTYFSIGLRPRDGGNVTPSTNSPPSYSGITSTLFKTKNNKFLRMFSDSTEWHDTHLYYKPTLVVGSPDDVSYWDTSSSSLKTKDVIPFSEMDVVANPPTNWSLRSRYLQTASTPHDDTNNDTKFTFFIDVPTGYTSSDKIFEVGYYITGIETNGSSDTTTRFYITRIDDYTTSSPKGFQIHTVPTDETKIPDKDTYTNTNWQYRKVTIPTLTVKGILKADNLGTDSLDATDLAVKKVCWSPVGANLPKACIYIAEDSTDNNKNKWFFDAETELDDIVFTGKNDNSVNYSWTAQEKLFGYVSGSNEVWTTKFKPYFNKRNEVLKLDNLADGDIGAKNPKLVMSVSASGVKQGANTTVIKGVDFFELTTDAEEIQTQSNVYNSSEDLIEYGKNALMSLYRHKRNSGTTNALSATYHEGNSQREEYFKVDTREYWYETAYDGYDETISSGNYDSFIRGTFDVKDHLVNPSSASTPTADDLLGFKLAGTLVEASATELNYLSGVTAGTTTGLKALVVNGNKELDYLKLTEDAYLPGVNNTNHGTYLGETLITATANEINILDGVTASTTELNFSDLPSPYTVGQVIASKVVVPSAYKHVEEWHIGDPTYDGSFSVNVKKHRLSLTQSDTTVDGNLRYDFEIKTASDTSPHNFSNLTVESQEHLYLKTQPYSADYNVNGNVYIQPDKSLYIESTNPSVANANYLFGTKKTRNFVSIGGDFNAEETTIAISSSTPTHLLYTDVYPLSGTDSTNVTTDKKVVILGIDTTQSNSFTPDETDYMNIAVGGVYQKLNIDTISTLNNSATATTPNITGYNDTARKWYTITLKENAPDSITGVFGQSVVLAEQLNTEVGVIQGSGTNYDSYESYRDDSNNADPFELNPYLFKSSGNVMVNRIDLTKEPYKTQFTNLLDASNLTVARKTGSNSILSGNLYLVGIMEHWEEGSTGDVYDGSTVHEENYPTYSTGGSSPTLNIADDDKLWAGKRNDAEYNYGIHDWHTVDAQSSNHLFLKTATVDGQEYDWFLIDFGSEHNYCDLQGYFGQLGNVPEIRAGSGFNFVQVTETGTFLENPDQALTLQGVMSMVGIDSVYSSPYTSSDTIHHYVDANSTTGYLQNPAPINNRGHLWFEKDTSSLQFSVKDDNLWNEEPIFTPNQNGDFTQLDDLSLVTTTSAEIAVDTEIIVEVTSGGDSSTNKFKWKKVTDNAYQAEQDMSTSNIALLSDSGSNPVVSVKWDSLTGHSVGSRWRFKKGNIVSKNLSSTAGSWEQVVGSQDIYMRSGYVGIFKRDAGVPDPISALHLAHTESDLLLEYPNDDAYSWRNTDAPDLIIREASASNPKSITLGLSGDSGTSYEPRLHISNDDFSIEAFSNDLFLQTDANAGDLYIGGRTDLGTMVSINDDVAISKTSSSNVLNVKNTTTASGTELKIADNENVLFDGTIKSGYTAGVSLVEPTTTIDNTTYDTDPSYYTGEKIFNIEDSSHTYAVLRRTPAFSLDNDSKGALGLGTDRPYKRLHVKDGNILIENGFIDAQGDLTQGVPTLSLGTPDLIYKSGTQTWGTNNYYAEIHLNKDARLNFSAGDNYTAYNATSATFNHGGKLDIIYRRGYNKIVNPGYTDVEGTVVSAPNTFNVDDQNLLEITTTSYAVGGGFPNDLVAQTPKTRFVVDGETGNVGIGGSFERHPAKESINPVYRLDVEGGMRLGINFNSLSGFEARTTGYSGGFLNDYKYTYNTTTNGTNSDFVITKEIVESVEKLVGSSNDELANWQHSIKQDETSNYPYAKNNTTDGRKMSYLATVQVSGMGVSYFSGGNVGIGKYFEDTRNVDGRKPNSNLHVKDFAFTEEMDDGWTYDNDSETGDDDSTIADANKFTVSNSVLMATFEDVEKSSYSPLHNSTQQTSKWLSNIAGGKLNIYTKRNPVDHKTIAISSENTRDGLLLDATGQTTGNSAKTQLYLQKDGDVGIGETFSFLENIANVITKRNTIQRVSNAGSGSNLSALQMDHPQSSNPQMVWLDDGKVCINTNTPDTTSTAGQFYNYTSTDNVDLEYVSPTEAKLTYNNITGYTVPDESDTLKWTPEGGSEITITVISASTSSNVVTLTTSGLSSFTTTDEFRHDLLGSTLAIFTVNGMISANNIDPSGTTIGHNDALSVKHGSDKHSALYRRRNDGSIGGKDLFLHAGNLDADLHFATFENTGTPATDNAKIRMTIGDSKTTATTHDSFIDMFEDVNIKTAKDFIIYDNTPVEKFKVLGATGNTTIAGTLGVTGLTTLGIVDIAGGTNSAIDNTAIGATEAFTGKFTTLESTGASTLASLGVTAGATIGTTLEVTGASTFNGNVGITSNKTFTVGTGQSTFNGNVEIKGAKNLSIYDSTTPTPVRTFYVVGSSGNTDIGGTLNIGSKSTGNLTINKAGDFTIKDATPTTRFTIDGASGNTVVGFSGNANNTGDLTVWGLTKLMRTEVASDMFVDDQLGVGFVSGDSHYTTFDVKDKVQFAGATGTVAEKRRIIASFTKEQKNSSGTVFNDEDHSGSAKIYISPRPFIDNHPLSTSGTESEGGQSSDSNVVELEVNAVKSENDHYDSTGLGDFLIKNHYSNTTGSSGFIRFYVARPATLTGSGNIINFSTGSSVVFGANNTYGQVGINRDPLSGLAGSTGATLALKGKRDYSASDQENFVEASIYFENHDNSKRGWITLDKDPITQEGKFGFFTEGSPTLEPLTVKDKSVELGVDIVTQLFNHTKIEETLGTSGSQTQFVVSNLDHLSDTTTDYIQADEYVRIYQYDNSENYIRRKVSSVNTTTNTITLDSAIPTAYQFSTVYFENANDGIGNGHSVEISNLQTQSNPFDGTIYTGNFDCVFEIQLGTGNGLSANQYQWRRTKSATDSDYTTWQTAQSFTSGTTQNLSADDTVLDDFGVRIKITATDTSQADTLTFRGRNNTAKLEVYSDIDIGATDNYFDDVYAQGFAMKKGDAPGNDTDYGKLWVKDSDGYLYFQKPNGASQQLSDLSNNFSNVNVNLVPDAYNTRNIGKEGTSGYSTPWDDRRTFKDIYYEGSLKKWNGTDGYTTIGETSVVPPTKHAIQINANSNTYVINKNTAPFSIVEEEFDNTIKESYLDLKFGWTPTGGEVVENAYAGTELEGTSGDQWGSNFSEILTSLPTTSGDDDDFDDVEILLNGTETVSGSDTVDSAVGSLEGTLSTGVAQTTSGKFGSGYSFNNSTPYHDGIDFGSNGDFGFGTGAFTIECWFNLTSTTTNNPSHGGSSVLCHFDGSDGYTNGSNHGVTLRTHETSNVVVKADFGASGGNNIITISGTTEIDTGKWYHVAFVRDGNNHRLYVNGKYEAGGNFSNCNYGDNELVIGSKKLSSDVNNFHGYIDDFRITKVARYSGTSTTTSGSGTISIGSNTDTHFSKNPETTTLSTSLLVPMDFLSWIDNKVFFKVKVNNTTDTEIKVDIYDTAQNQVGSTQTLSISSANTWEDISLTEFVAGGSPEWTKGDSFSLHLTTKLKKTSANVQLSTLRFQYNTESYSTTNVPLPHITSASGTTEIDEDVTVTGDLTASQDVLPDTNNTGNIGLTTKKWANVNATNVNTGDLNLNNEGSQGNDVDGTTGNWTVQEGDEDLFLINRKSGKKFKFKLEEIE